VSRLADEIAQVLRHSVDHLSPRRFEELVTEMYRRAGFEVELTPASGDGGVDVYAVRRHDLGSTPTVVQAKRYKPGLKVEASVVRELYGTVNLQDASAGVLITTSTFQPGAEALAAQHRYRLSLRNYASLQQMLRATASQRPEPCYRPSRRFSETQVQTERDIH
jgi:restriction system protein